MQLIATIASGSPQEPNVTISRKLQSCAVEGRLFPFQVVRDGLKKGIKKAWDKFDDLIGHLKFPELDEIYSRFTDETDNNHFFSDKLRCRQVGYSPFTDPVNGLLKFGLQFQDMLLDRNHNTLTGKGKIYTEGADGKLHYHDREVFAYFERVDEFLKVRVLLNINISQLMVAIFPSSSWRSFT